MHSIDFFADINECETEKHHCDSHAFCNNTKGSHICTCKPGYNGNGVNYTGKIREQSLSADSNNLKPFLFNECFRVLIKVYVTSLGVL